MTKSRSDRPIVLHGAIELLVFVLLVVIVAYEHVVRRLLWLLVAAAASGYLLALTHGCGPLRPR